MRHYRIDLPHVQVEEPRGAILPNDCLLILRRLSRLHREIDKGNQYCKCTDDITNGYPTLAEAKRDIGEYLMNYYNWQRPHQYNGGLPPAESEEKPKLLSGIS